MSDAPERSIADQLSELAGRREDMGRSFDVAPDEVQVLRRAAIHIRAAEAEIERLEVELEAFKLTIKTMTSCEICQGGDVTPAMPGNEHYIEREGIRMLVCDYHDVSLTHK